MNMSNPLTLYEMITRLEGRIIVKYECPVCEKLEAIHKTRTQQNNYKIHQFKNLPLI
jgi:predicted RNA-binding Zn-ribbon protein involved in translation (DUF1610 family)